MELGVEEEGDSSLSCDLEHAASIGYTVRCAHHLILDFHVEFHKDQRTRLLERYCIYLIQMFTIKEYQPINGVTLLLDRMGDDSYLSLSIPVLDRYVKIASAASCSSMLSEQRKRILSSVTVLQKPSKHVKAVSHILYKACQPWVSRSERQPCPSSLTRIHSWVVDLSNPWPPIPGPARHP